MKSTKWCLGLVMVALQTMGCGDDGPAAAAPEGAAPVFGMAAPMDSATDNKVDGQPMAGMGPSKPAANNGTKKPPMVAGSMPCEVATIAAKYCQSCHAAEPKFSAPMPLVSLSDFAAPSPTDASKTVAEMVMDRINRTEPAGKMPPASSEALPAAELAAFNAWLDAGHGAGEACGAQGAEVTPDATENPVLSDPSVKCYEFRAHGPSGSDEPYKVGIAEDAYFNFSFNVPWEGTRYARSFRTLIDNDQVVHHWLMYKDKNLHDDPGSVSKSLGVHPDGELIHGWAPGGDDLILNEEVGIAIGPTGLTLELHYNSADPDALDRSGIEICVTPNAPTNQAAISWLGTDLIRGVESAEGMCDPASDERIRILGGTPHMHTQGKHMTVEILRVDGSVEMLHDEDFDFAYQRSYDYQDKEIWLEPGDQVRTTCDWTGPVMFGEGTGDEMCYFFTLHYPALTLTAPGRDDQIHGPNTCGVWP